MLPFPMLTTITKAGRVAGPELVRRGERLMARPQAAEGTRPEIDAAHLIEEERDRKPDHPAPLPSR